MTFDNHGQRVNIPPSDLTAYISLLQTHVNKNQSYEAK